MKNNPIAFNPETMTVSQLKQCAEALRTAFDGIERQIDAENIVYHLDQTRRRWLRIWGEPK